MLKSFLLTIHYIEVKVRSSSPTLGSKGAGELKSIIIAFLGVSFYLSEGFKAFKAFTDLVDFFLKIDFKFKLFRLKRLVGF